MTNRLRRRFRVAPTANGAPPVASIRELGAAVSWALWLAVPVAATLLAAIWSWLRHRPRRPPDTKQAMQAHADYLDALVQTARAKDRGPYAQGPPD